VQGEFDETFATNAYQAGIESDYEEEDEDEPEMSEAKKEIIKEMTPHVRELLNAYQKNKGKVVKKLEDLDRRMVEQNQKENVFSGMHRLPMKFLTNKGAEYSKYKNTAAKPVNNEEDIKEIQGAERTLENIKVAIKERMSEEGLPLDWTVDLPKRRDLSLPRAERRKDPSQGSQGPNNSRERQGPYQKPQANNSFGSNYGTEPGPMEVDPKPTREWQPGETKRGEKILGYRPIRRQFQEMGTKRWVVTETSNMFVIEKMGENNPIAVVTRDRVGEKAAEAYEALPDSERCSLTNCASNYTRRDGSSITAILGYDREPQLTPSGNLPHTIFQVQYDEEKRLLNRSALCRAKGHKSACTMIEEFIDSIGDPPEESREDRLTVKALQVDSQINILRTRHTRQLTGRGASVHPLYSNADDGRARMRLGETRTQTSNPKNEIDDQTIRLMGMMTSTIIDALMEKLPQLHISPAN
jgi:hypothetical protein